MTNTNCLENIKCPSCGNEQSFRIAGTAVFTVTDDGTEDHGDIEWDDDNYAECRECHRYGTLKDFKILSGSEPTTVKSPTRIWQADYTNTLYVAPGGDADDAVELIEIRTNVTEAGWLTVAYVPAGWPDSRADASLIAAAPKLLKALEGALYALDRNSDGSGPSTRLAIAIARAAIAEATNGPEGCRRMTEYNDILDDLFHGCAWAAFLDQAVVQQGWPDSDATRRRAYAYYEEALACKNARKR